MHRRILLTRGNVTAYLAISAAIVFFANRFCGLYQLYEHRVAGESAIMLDLFLPTMIDYPLFLDRSSVTLTVFVAALLFLYFIVKFDISGDEAMKRVHRGEEYGGAHWATNDLCQDFGH